MKISFFINSVTNIFNDPAHAHYKLTAPINQATGQSRFLSSSQNTREYVGLTRLVSDDQYMV